MPPPSDDDWKKLSKLVDVFYNRADAEPFREPVDWKTLGLFDYPQVVSEPMDLGTVKSRLKGKKYTAFSQVGADVNKIWENCKEYNRAGSDFHKLAVSLQKKWDDRYTKLLAEVRPSADESAGQATGEQGSSQSDGRAEQPRASLTDRRNFAKSLFHLSKEDVGKILVDIEAKCPLALVRNASEDEVELNVDKIPASLLHELNQYVSSQKKKKSSGAKRAKTSKQ